MAGSGTAHLRSGGVLLRVEDLVVEFPTGRGQVVHAVSGVSFDVAEGETLGIVGESGCGKSTAARAVIQLPRPTAGSVRFRGTELTELQGEELRRVRPSLQMIFQDPISSLNPRRTVREIVAEGLRIWSPTNTDGPWSEAWVDEVLESVGLDPHVAGERKPHEFSGGQCQRISIARAVALDPKLLVCDEPVSALDVSVQAQILNLLEDMKQRYGLTLLFISHDLSVVKHISDRVMVMYLGKVCEVGDAESVYSRPAHPYTRALLASVPDPAPGVDQSDGDLSGEVPSPIAPPTGCRFHTRCPRAQDVCRTTEPQVAAVGADDGDHWVACHFPHV
jgi:peptide/nickel transport system ATP-binding protein